MNDELMVAQGTISDQAAAEALQTITEGIHYAGGNALLAAEAKVRAEIDNPVINGITETKIASSQATNKSTEGKQFTTNGNHPLNSEHLSEDEDLSLTNDVSIAE
mgnify:CR=1 FL=1